MEPGNAKAPPPGSIGELKCDSGSGTYFGVDPKLDMVYILTEQTQLERSRILAQRFRVAVKISDTYRPTRLARHDPFLILQ